MLRPLSCAQSFRAPDSQKTPLENIKPGLDPEPETNPDLLWFSHFKVERVGFRHFLAISLPANR